MGFASFGTMRTQPGQREAVIAILLEGIASLDAAGCRSYIVGVPDDDPDLICVTEHWESREAHAASLQLPAVREAIGRAMPLLTGEFSGQRMDVRGGIGA